MGVMDAHDVNHALIDIIERFVADHANRVAYDSFGNVTTCICKLCTTAELAITVARAVDTHRGDPNDGHFEGSF